MLAVIADDVTGACDVGAELAMAGLAVRVAVDGGTRARGTGGGAEDDVVRVLNTQSRALSARHAYERVCELLRRRPADLLLKKIDTALRGHLGAELEGVLDGLGAVAVFVLPAIPAAGRATRAGCQWFGGRPLAASEFASDPEGPGAESSVAAVVARESRQRTEVIGQDVVCAGRLAERVVTLTRAGAVFFVVDAETDDDLARAVAAILELPRPLCLAGSIGLAAALAPRLVADGDARVCAAGVAGRAASGASLVPPALVVCGSLHSTARAQIDAALAADLVVAVPAPAAGSAVDWEAAAACARGHLAAGRHVVVAPPAPAGTPQEAACRATERQLADLTYAIVAGARAGTLVLIGGETSYAVLARLGATELAVRGRWAPLVAVGEVLAGVAAGAVLISKGGSGGDPGTLARLLGQGGVAGATRAAG